MALTAPKPRVRSFTAEDLARIAFPLGGIGAGTVSLGGRGDLRDWEIFNHAAKGRNLPYTFFAIHACTQGHEPVTRVLERRILPPYDAGFGLPTSRVSGLPRLREARFRGAYPVATIDFVDSDLPVQVRLDAWNPMIPMDDVASGLPVALFRWSLRNPGDRPVEATVCFSLLNVCGYDGRADLGNRHLADAFGGNRNELVREPGMSGIRMSTGRFGDGDPRFGTMAVTTSAPSITWLTRWERAGWWDDVQSFWDRFRADGGLPDGPEAEDSPDGETDVGSLGVRLVVPPGETKCAPFCLAWHFPCFINDWNEEPAVRGKGLRNWYATQWPDAWSVARYVTDHLDELETGTAQYVDALFGSTLPAEVLDAASANSSILRTTTCMRTDDGRLHGFEGCHDTGGCCPMNCTHVWNYEQATAFLYPALERSVRETDFTNNTRADGYMAFRTLLPLAPDTLWAFKPAADGQMGTVMKVYREWLLSGDRGFLKRMWPGVVRALEFAWKPGSWDEDRDGVMEGEQHNTYDIEFYGPNTMTGMFYLGALRAAEEMARELGETDRADEYRRVFESGRRKYSADLWNGEYFRQTVATPPDVSDPRYQYGSGCLSDHMLGQWFARVIGLGDLLPRSQVRSAVHAIFEHNFCRDLSAHESVQRVYALNDEAGLLLCTWPNGGRPAYPFPYADEVWTGIEYQVAAHLIYEGFVPEGLEIVRGVRNRYDGCKRNPWDECECGHHYARAMSSWSLILALSGFELNVAHQRIGFRPVTDADVFRTFFSAGTAWGVFARETNGGSLRAELDVRWGEMALREITIGDLPGGVVAAAVGGHAIGAEVRGGAIVLAEPVKLAAGECLTVSVG